MALFAFDTRAHAHISFKTDLLVRYTESEDEVVSRRRADGTGQPFDEWEYLMSEDTFERLRDETFLQ